MSAEWPIMEERRQTTATIDPVRFGELIAELRAMREGLGEVKGAMEGFETRLEHVESKLLYSKGVFAGMLLVAGATGASLSEAIKHFLGVVK